MFEEYHLTSDVIVVLHLNFKYHPRKMYALGTYSESVPINIYNGLRLNSTAVRHFIIIIFTIFYLN